MHFTCTRHASVDYNHCIGTICSSSIDSVIDSIGPKYIVIPEINRNKITNIGASVVCSVIV